MRSILFVAVYVLVIAGISVDLVRHIVERKCANPQVILSHQPCSPVLGASCWDVVFSITEDGRLIEYGLSGTLNRGSLGDAHYVRMLKINGFDVYHTMSNGVSEKPYLAPGWTVAKINNCIIEVLEMAGSPNTSPSSFTKYACQEEISK